MAYRTIDDNDTIQIRRVQGGNKPETRTVAELNEYFSKEENTEIGTLQAQVGDYDPDTTESTITDDLEQLQTDVQTTETGLLDRTAALEAIVQTAASGTPVAPVAATLTTGTDNSELLWTAKTAGTTGEAISVMLEIPATELTITPSVGGNASAIKYTGVKGKQPISITYVMAGTNAFGIAAAANAITITMASTGGTCETTAADLFAALKTAIGAGGELEGIISAVEKAVPGEWADATLMEANAQDWLDSTLSVATVGNAITVSLAYNGGTDAITTTANDIITELGTHELVTVAATGTGTDPVAAEAEANLDNGADGTVGKAGELRYNDTTLYVSDGESTEAVSNWLSAPLLPTLPTVIDLSDAEDDYVIEDGKNSIVVLTDNAATAKDIILPAAIVGLRVTIINQDNASVDISAASGEYLNGSANNPFTLTSLNSATFYCYADGYWAII